jgi:hypothetical protein
LPGYVVTGAGSLNREKKEVYVSTLLYQAAALKSQTFMQSYDYCTKLHALRLTCYQMFFNSSASVSQMPGIQVISLTTQ